MIASELMFKIWDGDAQEFFRPIDMNRLAYNANIVAQSVGVAPAEFIEADRTQQFRYDEAQKLETLISSSATAAGVSVPTDTYWGTGHSLSYVDFDRWESSLFTVYKALGGLGERIPAGTVLSTYSFMLFKGSWQGTGPYHIDLDAPAIHDGTEAVAFVPHHATVLQRAAEYGAVLQTSYIADRRIRVSALGVKPTEDVPIRLKLGGFPMYTSITLTASGWSGSGPWTQNATLSGTPGDAVIGPSSSMTDSEVEAMASAIISVSAVNGSTITVRAIGEKPTVDLHPGIMWGAAR